MTNIRIVPAAALLLGVSACIGRYLSTAFGDGYAAAILVLIGFTLPMTVVWARHDLANKRQARRDMSAETQRGPARPH